MWTHTESFKSINQPTNQALAEIQSTRMAMDRQRFLTKEQETLAIKEKTNLMDFVKISDLTESVKM